MSKYMKSEVNPFSVPCTRTIFSLLLNGILENVLVCAQVKKNKQILPIVYAYSRSYLDFWDNIDYVHFICPNCALGALISANVYTYRMYTCIMYSMIIAMFGFKDKKVILLILKR